MTRSPNLMIIATSGHLVSLQPPVPFSEIHAREHRNILSSIFTVFELKTNHFTSYQQLFKGLGMYFNQISLIFFIYLIHLSYYTYKHYIIKEIKRVGYFLNLYSN